MYNIPSEGYRGKVLKIQLDTVLINTVDQTAVRAQTYYFMPPIDVMEGNLWIQKPMSFYYNRYEDSFWYSGRTNFIDGPTDDLYKKVRINWTQDNLFFGFIEAFSPTFLNPSGCVTDKEKYRQTEAYRFGVTYLIEHEYGL